MDALATRTQDELSVNSLSYTDIVALVRETNRCPGGMSTIARIAKDCFLSSSSTVLEIGSNTGFTALELSRATGCTVVGIDINEHEVSVANQTLLADVDSVRTKVSFAVGSAYDLDFPDDHFDLVVTGGAFSFMERPQRALAEAARVIKPWRYLSTTNLCYQAQPPESLLAEVSSILGVTIQARSANDWLDIYRGQSGLQQLDVQELFLEQRTSREIIAYVDYFRAKPHIQAMSEDFREKLLARWKYVIEVFNRNHAYLGYVSIVHRKAYLEQEPELFRS